MDAVGGRECPMRLVSRAGKKNIEIQKKERTCNIIKKNSERLKRRCPARAGGAEVAARVPRSPLEERVRVREIGGGTAWLHVSINIRF